MVQGSQSLNQDPKQTSPGHMSSALWLDCLALENGTGRLFQNVNNHLPIFAA